jgi:uncharacterized protein (DUF1697 family)
VSTWVAFLRGVNLGKRTVKSADLKACLEALGCTDVKTIIASGNVRFATDKDKGLKARLEKGLEDAFGFSVGVVLRSLDEIAVMVESKPFAKVDPKADVALHVLMADEKIAPRPDLSSLPDHIEVPRIDERDIYLVAHRLPNGRYTEGMEKIDKLLPKGLLITMRNWNTMLKALA